MPLNLIKLYNALLDIDFLSEQARNTSLRAIFDRDFRNQNAPLLDGQPVYPVPSDPNALDQLFSHLTTHESPPQSRRRQYEAERSRRLHWVRCHIEATISVPLTIFETDEKGPKRVYVLNEAERYVIVLEPLRKGGYYLLTAYPLKDDSYRKMMRSYERTQSAARRRRP